LSSGDKLIGAAQSGILVGRKEVIDRLRRHPLMRAVRVDKTCLMVLERTLQLFRRPEELARLHPTYRMMSTPHHALEARAKKLLDLSAASAPSIRLVMAEGVSYLGSGSLPMEAIPTVVVTVHAPSLSASELARRLRLDEACVFTRIEKDRVCLDMRTITDEQVNGIVRALQRIARVAPADS